MSPTNLHLTSGRSRAWLVGAVAIVLLGAAWTAAWQAAFRQPPARGAATDPQVLADCPIDGDSAYGHLKQLCDLGPRPTGSEAMLAQQALLIKYFESLGAQVRRQSFDVRHPQDGSAVTVTNLIVELHPERPERLLVAAHYDTRPFPDRDPHNSRGSFVGANDGASGTALIMELAKHAAELPGKLGVDLVLFDAEEFVFNERTDKYFVGSEHFSRELAAGRGPARYRAGVLLDMVGDADLQMFMEPNSLRFAPTVTNELWTTARKLGIREFIWAPLDRSINDDHMPLNTIAHVPTCDLIDFQYPAWHTEADTPDRCSGQSLSKVGWVVLEWLKTAVR